MKNIFNNPLYYCESKNYYFICFPISILYSIIIIILSIIHYKFAFKKNEKLTVSIAKYTIRNSSFIFILIQPIALIIRITAEKHNNYKKYLIYYLFISSLILLFYSYYEHKYQNNDDLEELINYFLCCIYCWICFCLIFGKIINISGMIYPFLIGIFFLFVIFKYWPVPTLQMRSDIYFHSDLELFNQLRLLINAVINQDIRENNLNLLSYFFTYIKNNYNKDEFDKLYDMSSEEIRFLFFQYIENTFKIYNQVFKDSIPLKIMNAFFLMRCLGQYKKSYMMFYSLLEEDTIFLTYSQEFFIFRQKKYLENKLFEVGSDSSDISTFFQINTFIKLISNISDLYINFWSILLQSNENEDCFRLYESGEEICNIRDEIEYIFSNLIKSNVKDKKIFILYGYYLKEILNDHESALEYLKNSDIENYQEMLNVGNFTDLNKTNKTSDFQYIIVSGKKDNFGIIEKVSLGICNLIGYSYEKICGQNINIFLPNFIYKEHEKLLQKTVKEYFKNYNLKLGKNSLDDIFYHNVIFMKTSSKYLYPIPLQIGVSIDENFDCVIFAKIDFYSQFDSNEYLNNTCHIITDTNLIIQETTSNSIIFFENNNFANKSLDITTIIKELYQEFYSEMSFNPRAKKLEVKKSILKKRYMTEVPIKVVTITNKRFKLNCKEMIINDKICGYHFNLEIINDIHKCFEFTVNGFNSPRKRKFSQTQFSFLNKEFSFVNGDYIPEGKQFYFNVEKRTFFPKKSNLMENNNLEGNLKNYFHNKFIKSPKNKKNSTFHHYISHSDDSSNFENFKKNSSSDTEEESSAIISEDSDVITISRSRDDKQSDNEDIDKKEEIENKNDNLKKIIEEQEDYYYKIKPQKISFLMYDFEKNMCVNIKLPLYINKVEEILNFEKRKNPLLSKPKKRKTKLLNLQELKQIIQKSKNDYSENIHIQDIINEKIKPKTINKSVLIHLLTTIISFIIIFITILVFCIKIYNEHQNLSLLTKMLIEFSNLSIDAYKIIFTITELFFISNEKYKVYNRDPFLYADFLIDELKYYYNHSFSNFLILRNNNVKLTKKNKQLIDNYSIKLYSIADNFTVYESYTKLPYLINEYYANVYEILFLPFKKRIFSNKNYNYIFYNTDNGFSAGTSNYSEIYRDDFYIKINNFRAENIICMILIFILELFICFFEIYTYSFIQEEKNVKMKFFFKMTNEQISICIKKCQNFRMLSQDNLNEPSNLLKNPNINFDSSEINNINDNESTTLLSNNINYYQLKNSMENKTQTVNTIKKKIRTKFKLKKGQISYIIFCLIILFFIGSISFLSDKIYFKGYNYLLIHYTLLHHEIFFFKRYVYLKMYIIYEYYFNEKPYLKERADILFDFVETGYTQNSEYLNDIHKSINSYGLPKKTKKQIEKIRFENICEYYTKMETVYNKSCLSFSDGILLKGFEPLSIYLVDTFIYYIKDINNSFEKAKLNNYIYNEYLYGTNEYQINLPKDKEDLKQYQEQNPINIVNDERLNNIIVLINEIYLPLMNEIAGTISSDITSFFDFFTYLIIAISNGFIVFIFGYLLFFVFPTLFSKNRGINKVRRMLEIIPKDIIFNLFIVDEQKINDE